MLTAVAICALIFWAIRDAVDAMAMIGIVAPAILAKLIIAHLNKPLSGCDLRNDYTTRDRILLTLVLGAIAWPFTIWFWTLSQV